MNKSTWQHSRPQNAVIAYWRGKENTHTRHAYVSMLSCWLNLWGQSNPSYVNIYLTNPLEAKNQFIPFFSLWWILTWTTDAYIKYIDMDPFHLHTTKHDGRKINLLYLLCSNWTLWQSERNQTVCVTASQNTWFLVILYLWCKKNGLTTFWHMFNKCKKHSIQNTTWISYNTKNQPWNTDFYNKMLSDSTFDLLRCFSKVI